MNNLEQLRKTLNSQAGKDLKEFLVYELLKMKNIDNIKVSLNPIKMAIEVIATKKAFDKLNNIFDKLISLSGEVNKTDPRDKYL